MNPFEPEYSHAHFPPGTPLDCTTDREAPDGKGGTTDMYNDGLGITRQEEKHLNDATRLMNSIGGAPFTRAPLFGDTNYDWDLQQVLGAIKESDTLIARLPQPVLHKYPTNTQLLAALHNGELQRDTENFLKEELRKSQAAKATASASSPSAAATENKPT